MSSYLDVRNDDALFAARLQEVNKEMDTLLHKTSRTRHELDRTAAEVRMGVPLHFYPRDAATGALQATATLPSLPGSSLTDADAVGGTVRDDVARSVVSAELSQWVRTQFPSLVAPLVDAQVQRHLHDLRTRVDDVEARQRSVEAAASDTAAQLRTHRRDLHAGLSDFQRNIQQDMEVHQRTVEGQLTAWKEELQGVQAALRAVQDRGRGEMERVDRQLDAALHRQQQQVQETFSSLDHEMQRWRLSVQRDLEKSLRSSEEQQNALEGQVAQVHGTLSSIGDMTSRAAAELQRVMEDAVARASEVRLCRRDVNRLEMLVQCTALQTAVMTTATTHAGRKSSTRSKSSDAKEKATADEAAASVVPALESVAMIPQAVAHLDEKVQAVVARVDGLDRQVRQLDMTLARGAAGLVRSSYVDNLRDYNEDSVFTRSAASTRRFSNSQHSSLHAGRGASGPRGYPSFMDPAQFYQPQRSDERHSMPRPADTRGDNENRGGSSTGHHDFEITPRQLAATPTTWMRSPPPPAGPQPTALDHAPPTPSHLSSESAPFEDYAEDPHPMPVVVRDSRPATAGMFNSILAAKGFVSRNGSPPQRRSPPRVIPVEAVPSPVEAAAAAGGAAASESSHSLPAVDNGKSAEDSDAEAVEDAPKAGELSPFAYSLDRYGESYGMGSLSSTGQVPPPTEKGSGVPVTKAVEASKQESGDGAATTASSAAASSPADSYVSDTPAAAASASFDGRGRYTPAPASDSEDERDNEVISRSALD